jgi:16S rRNA (adenine1518-N6/adenine1519-N6)-dimethyltransferase
MEVDPPVLRALLEVVESMPTVRVVEADALRADWSALLGGDRWALVANLPYSVSVPLLERLLAEEPSIDPLVVMVQREVADRLLAAPGDEAYGPLAVRVAHAADVRFVRRVPADVFWPKPTVDSAIVRLDRHAPPVGAEPAALFRVADAAFEQRRKTIANAVRRLGASAEEATRVCAAAGVEPSQRPERIDLAGFARLTGALVATGWRP